MFSTPAIPHVITPQAQCVQTDVGNIWLQASDQVLLPYMHETGRWEPSEAKLLRRLLTKTTRFLDIGAHVGYFSLLAAQTNTYGSIDAIEPDPANYALLRMNLWQYAPHARTWGVALGRHRGLASLTTEVHNSGNTCVTGGVSLASALTAVVSGDDLFDGRSFDLIKIDVQGQESEVLGAMPRLLQRSSRLRIVAEFFPHAIRARGLDPRAVLQLYRELNLQRAVSINDQLLPLDDTSLLHMCDRAGREGYVNLLLTRSLS